MSKVPSKDLQDYWYQKLADTGFEDVEAADGRLKSWASSELIRARKQGRSEYNKSKEDYFRAAGHFLHEYKFESPREEEIWRLHSSGLSNREVVRKLAVEGFKTSREAIRLIINRLSSEMKSQC